MIRYSMLRILVLHITLTVSNCVGGSGSESGASYDPCANPDPFFLTGTFPPGFMWSTATAAYQVEGGWNLDGSTFSFRLDQVSWAEDNQMVLVGYSGKGPSIWDHFVHETPSPIKGGSTGDVTCDSYHRYHDDIQIMKAMGVNTYRLSISWPRLVPTGIVSEGVNFDGYLYYRNLLQSLIYNGITPMVTIYHWDLPQHLQDQGGWLNSSSIGWYLNYADLCFTLYGDLVKNWITFNEPWVVTVNGYTSGEFAPGIKNCPGTCPYIVAHNIIRAHAHAWQSYDAFYRAQQNGKVGISLNSIYKVPATQSAADVAATERAMEFKLGWFANPIFNNGDYPQVMKDVIGNRSMAEGRSTSRLPAFTTMEKQFIKGTSDFFGINIYTTFVMQNAPNDPTKQPIPNYPADTETTYYQCSSWQGSGSSWLKVTPWAARGLLNWVRKKYNNPPIIITENGVSDNNASTTDPWRVNFIKYYVNEALKALQLDGCNLQGYTHWSTMDNFEWVHASGYTEKFGLHAVDFSNPLRPRVPKLSASYYASLIANNGFPGPGPCSCGNSSREIPTDGGSQLLVSPGWPNSYCNSMQCQWSLVVPGTQRVFLTFSSFNTQYGYDFLKVLDSNGAILESCSGSLCYPVRSNGNTMTLLFNSDSLTTASGFQAQFTAFS